MRRRMIVLLVVMLVSGVLMGMSGTEDTGLKLSVKKVSKADEGREIYTGQESVSLVLAGMSMQRELRHQMYNGSCVGAEII